MCAAKQTYTNEKNDIRKTFQRFNIQRFNLICNNFQSGHMAVIEALMVLYAREVVTLDRVSAAVQRFGSTHPSQFNSGVPHEDGILYWINAACVALNKAEVGTFILFFHHYSKQ